MAEAGRSIKMPDFIEMQHSARTSPQYAKFYAIIYDNLNPTSAIVMPKKNDSHFGIGQLVTILAVGIACIAAPYLVASAFPALASAAGVAAGAAGTAGAAGAGAAAATITATGVAEFAAATGVTAGLLNAGQQGIAVNMGLQDHFSLSEALTTAMTAATAQYYGGEVSSAFKTLNSEATAAHAGTLVLASAKQAVALQVGNMIAGTSSHFDIKEVVTNMAQSLASIKAGSYSENSYASAAYATTAASAVDSVATHNVSIEALGAQMLGNEALAGVSVAAQKYLQPSAQKKKNDLSDESTQSSTAHGSTYDEHQREVDDAFYNKMEKDLPGQLPDPSLDISLHAQALADTNARAGSWKTQTQQNSGIATAGTWKAMPKQSFTNAVANDLSNDAYNAYDAAKAFNSDKSGSMLRLLKAMETRVINAVSQEVQNTPKLIFDVARSAMNPSSILMNNFAEQGEQLVNSVPSLYNAYSNADPATRSAMLARGVATSIEVVGAAALTRGAGFGVSALRGMSLIGSASRVGVGIVGEVGSVGIGESLDGVGELSGLKRATSTERFINIVSGAPKDEVRRILRSGAHDLTPVQTKKVLEYLNKGSAQRVNLKIVKSSNEVRLSVERAGRVDGYQRFSYGIDTDGNTNIIQTAFDDANNLVRQASGESKNKLYDVKKWRR